MGSKVFSSTYSMYGYVEKTYNVRVSYSEVYDQAQNKSTITITGVELQIVGNGTNWGSLAFFGSVAVNGTTLLSMNGGASVRVSLSGSGYCSVAIPTSSSVAVAHNDAGGGTFSMSVTGGLAVEGMNIFGAEYSGKGFGVKSQSANVDLTAHPRASTISSCPSTIATNSALALGVTRNSSAFYHKATFKVGGTTLYTSGAFATALNYTIPRTWFNAYPSSTSLSVTVSVQTYTDSTCTTTVGSPATATMTVTADADMMPSVTSGWVAAAAYNTGAVSGMTGYIKGYSRATVTFNAAKITHANGATLDSYSIVCQGVTSSSTSTTHTSPVLASTSVEIVCTVTDSRGRSASTTLTLSVMDYAAPSLSGISVFRCGSLGIADDDGTYYSVKATVAYSSLGGQNSCALTCAIKASGGSYGAEQSLTSGTARVLGTISADTSYTVRIRATDTVGNTAYYYANISSRKWAMRFRPTGNGVAFGKAAEYDNTFEVASGWAVKIAGQTVADFIVERGTSGDWTYIKYASGKCEAWTAFNAGSVASSGQLNGWYWTTYSKVPPSFFTSVEYAGADAKWGTGISWGDVRDASSSSVQVVVFGNQDGVTLAVRILLRGTYTV